MSASVRPRTTRRYLFDSLYFSADILISDWMRRFAQWRLMRGIKVDKEFYRSYREDVLPYWKQYGVKPKKSFCKLEYMRKGRLDPRSVPNNIHHRYVVPYFDNPIFIKSLTDKNLHSLLFPDVKRPETIFKRSGGCYCNDNFTPIPEEEACRRLEQPGRFIVKPARFTGGGSHIEFIDGPLEHAAAQALLQKWADAEYIVQRIIVQHPSLNEFSDTSVNTMRVETLVFHGEAHILSAVLRIGKRGSRVDNTAQGGYLALIRPDGTLDRRAFTERNGDTDFQYIEQTDEGKRFEDFAVPSWEKVRDTALDLALKLPQLKLIGWDLAVDEAGDVVLIEYNCHFAPNQDELCGPLFGDMTDEVLAEVFASKKLRL